MITKILHISANQYPKLPEDHHSKVIWQELSKNCDEYHIFARAKNMSFSHSVEGKIHLHLIPSFGTRQFVFLVLSFLLPIYFIRYKPSHVIAQCPVLGGLVSALFKPLFNYKLFVEVHGEHYFTSIKKRKLFGKVHHLFFKYFTSFTFKRADKIRSLSEDMTNYISSSYGAQIVPKIKLVPNRVNLNVFDKVKDDYAVSGILKVITVGRFSDLKNHKNLIKDLYASGIAFQLTVVGNGSMRKDYIELVQKLGSINDLIILENISHKQLSTILPQQDLYIHYSLSEGVPRAILEAMATGLPVITTNVGYIKGVVDNGINGFTIDEPYKNNLLVNLNALVKSKEDRARIGIGARKKIEKEYEWNYVFDLYRQEIMSC